MTPNQLGDFYEGVAWRALETIYGSKLTYWGRKKKTAFKHTCGQLCESRLDCQKHRVSAGLIYTVPDFFVNDDECPVVVHICHWNSKETSHAKFWRTISELYELKCFMPNVRCINIVFESSYDNGNYTSSGWYPEFLKAFHFLFDKTVFFDDVSLASDAIKLGHLKTVSARNVFDEIGKNPSNFDAPSVLAKKIRNARHPNGLFQRELPKMWKWEREFCKDIPVFNSSLHQGEKLRNAMLQVAMIAIVFGMAIQDVIEGLNDLVAGRRNSKNALQLKEIDKLPVSNREDEFQFCATSHVGAKGVVRIELHEDLEWAVRCIRSNSLGVTSDQLIRGIERTARLFSSSPQVAEAITGIRLCLAGKTVKGVALWSAEDWFSAYQSVNQAAEYNEIGELLLSGTCSGTYEIVSKVNARSKDSPVSRNDIRSFYTNKRTGAMLVKHRKLIKRILDAFDGEFDWTAGQTAFLLRKTGRIVGPQSAINPLEELLMEILGGVPFAEDSSLVTHQTTFTTLATGFSVGEDLGSWRVAACLQKGGDSFPIFLSGMKSLADCGHKTREFTGHLRMARYGMNSDQIVQNHTPRYGLAVLEGGYTEAEKRAFHLAGYFVTSISAVVKELRNRGFLV
jgi:hypothetical protein